MLHKLTSDVILHQLTLRSINSYRAFSSTNVRYKSIMNYQKLITNYAVKNPKRELTWDEELFNLLKGKVSYNCFVSKRNNFVRWAIRNVKVKSYMKKGDRTESIPLSLKYAYGDEVYKYEEFKKAFSEEEIDDEYLDDVNFPYSNAEKVEIQSDTENGPESTEELVFKYRKRLEDADDIDLAAVGGSWMGDYIVFEEDNEPTENVITPQTVYGTPDPNVLPSNVPCGGCGAHLHCQNPSVPGYLPKELFLKCDETDLRALVCQRCNFLKIYNVALSVSVDPDCYPKLISKIRGKNALVIMMVDMTNFPCSIWPNVIDVVGNRTPILILGNKIDLVPGDSANWLARAKKILREAFPRSANIVDVQLVSAKNGFNIESLITLLHAKWGMKGDVYIVGCTNVGKSSLFNALLQSDYCKSDSIDLIQRATVSSWPGTTLNLLKFPILRLSSWRSALRYQRISSEAHNTKMHRKFEELQLKEEKKPISVLPKIIGTIGISFPRRKGDQNLNMLQKEGQFSMPRITTKLLEKDDRVCFDPDSDDYKHSNWCYDTPGVVHNDQIIDLLTIHELNILNSVKPFRPRFFMVHPEETLFIAGLARVDLLEFGGRFVRFIIYSNGRLPITICKTEYADEVYNTLVGTKFFCIPYGSEARLEKWPHLKTTQDYKIKGQGSRTCTSEIVLSSAGWISFTALLNSEFKVRPWTPDGRGIHFRSNPLLLNTPLQRRRKIAFTPTYYTKSL